MEDIRFARSILLGVDLEGSGNKDGIRLSGDVVSLRIHIGSPEVRQPFFSPRVHVLHVRRGLLKHNIPVSVAMYGDL